MGRAVFVRELGGPEVLRVEPHDPGEPAPGQVRVRLGAAGLNYIDTYFRRGAYPRPLPFVLGFEGAGTVERVGEGVTDLAVGDRVAWPSVPASYSDRVLAPAERVVRVPDSISDDLAAAAMMQGMTAHYLARSTRETRPGDRALVHAAAGGTGLLLVQMLKAAGATVIGTCSTAEKERLARAAGCDHVIRYGEEDFVAGIERLTGGEKLEVVYDSVGQTTFEGSLRCLRPRGLVVLFGMSSGPVPPFDLARLNALGSLFVTRPSLAHYIRTREELERRAGEVLGAVERGELRLRIGARFPLTKAADAHRALEGRETTGKVILEP
jgi:NADPH2:quinone reductase